jgi:drug/metabolite transporter (DMT)-like permease
MTARPLLPSWVWLVLLWLVWGTSWPAMRTAFLEMPVWQFRALTSLIGGMALLYMAKLAGGNIRLAREDWGPLALAGFFNITVWLVASGYGLTMIGAGHAAVVCYTLPVWTALFSVIFFKERLSARVLASLVLGMGGVAVLASHDFAALGAEPLGLVFVLVAAVSWAIGTLLIKRRRWSAGMNALAGWQLLMAVVPIGIVALVTERFTLHAASNAAIFSGFYILIVGVILGYALWFKVVSLFPATIASIGSLVTPVIGMMSSAALLAEPLGWRELAALALVLGAVAIVIFRRAVPADAAARAPERGTAARA